MTPLIQLKGVPKHYRIGDTLVVAPTSVDLDVASGKFVASSGPSGSGKITLLNIRDLLDHPDAGHHYLNGENAAQLTAFERTKLRGYHIGFVFQSFNLIPTMTAYENVEYPILLNAANATTRRQRVVDILEQAGSADFARHMLDRLSGGQRQRVAIARGLVKHLSLVIADEPTANLDTITANQIIDLTPQLAA